MSDKTVLKTDSDLLSVHSITDEINKTLAVYKADASRVIADYRSEKQYTADYNGRQILELLQNADDAKTNAIEIAIQTASNELKISNNGEPFTLEGVKSLMLANMSPKNKREYIGNKGLGFRSILNWVAQVDVISEQVVLQFSQEFAKTQYRELLKSSTVLRQLVQGDKNIEADETPIAVLAIPEVKENQGISDWVTSIKLHYKKEEEESILQQVHAIQEETLLFLRHTQRIVIQIDAEPPKQFIKKKIEKNITQVNNKTWHIHHSGDRSFDDNKKYSFQIAWQGELQDEDAVFYTYFPTDVKTHLPCLIHATFDLNASRKEINLTDENRVILNAIAADIASIAANKLISDGESSNWLPYRFLNTIGESDNRILTDFFDKIRDYKERLAIYPSVDGSYYSKEKIIRYSNTVAGWVQRNDLGSDFHSLLLPTNTSTNDNTILGITNRYTPTALLEICKQINLVLKDPKQRVKFIKILASAEFENIHNGEIKFPLLLERTDETEGQITNKQVFTIRQDEVTSFYLPEYVTGMSFISPSFFDLLVEEFSQEIAAVRNDNEDISRPLKRTLDPIVNIGSNDIIDVIRFIVSETDRDKTKVLQLIKSLFSIFKENPDRRGKLPFKIPLLNRQEEVVDSNELFFGNEHAGGDFCEYIFRGIYMDNDYLIGNHFWKLDTSDPSVLSNFFLWLGVNKYLQIEQDTKESTPSMEYQAYVFSKVRRPDKIKHHYFRGFKISNADSFKRLPIEYKLALILKESFLKQQLDENHKDVYKQKYGSGYPKPLYGIPSYIEYQIASSEKFEDYIIENDLNLDVLFKTINFNAEVFNNFKLSTTEIKVILEKLGAIKSLDYISIQKFHSLFNHQTEMFPEGKGSASFYKKYLEYCIKHKEISTDEGAIENTTLMCFARKGGRKENPLALKPVSEIYYSDNNLVPQEVLDNYWILYLPKRLGERNVKRYFGVKLMQEVLSTITLETIEASAHNDALCEYINTLKPYFLYCRLNSIKDNDSKNEAVNLTKSIAVKLVKECTYRFGDDKSLVLQDNYFMKIDSTYYIRSSAPLEVLRKNIIFADTVAEVLSTHYKVKEHHDKFRSIFKDEIQETKYVITSEDGDEVLAEAKKLLGVSKAEHDFWSKLLSYQIDFEKIDKNTFRNAIENRINHKLPTNYDAVDFLNLSNEDGFNFLKWLNTHTAFDIKNVISEDTLAPWHEVKLNDTIRDYSNDFRRLLWEQANTSDNIELKKEFFSQCIRFDDMEHGENLNEFLVENRFELEPDYNLAIKQHALTEYSIDLNDSVEADFNLNNRYLTLFEGYSFGSSIDDREKWLKSEKPSIYSLIFFAGYKEEIRASLDELECNNADDNKADSTEKTDGGLEIIQSKLNKFIPNIRSKLTNSGTYSHNSKGDIRKAKSGKKAEDSVEQALKNKGYSVRNVAKHRDTKHYDLDYKKPGEDYWRHLEVKKDSGGFFFLSKAEKETALHKDNREKYDIAVVSDNAIHIIEKPFHFQDESFENNSNFYAEPTEYKISFKIKN